MAVDDPGDHVGEVNLRVDTSELAGLDQRSNDGPMFAAAVGTSEEGVFSVQRDRANGAFDDIGVDLDSAIVNEAREPLPARERIADRLGKLCLLADEVELATQPGFELVEDGFALLLPNGTAFGGIAAADLLFDGIEISDARQQLAGDGCRTGCGKL